MDYKVAQSSRRTISELAKSARAGVYRDVNMDSEMTEESMEVVMQEQFERKKQPTLTAVNREFVKSINAYSLILVVLATVTYSGFWQPPGSFDDEGYIRTPENRSLTWFVYFNSLAFYFSVADLILCLSGNFAPLADLHAEAFLSPAKSKTKLKQSSAASFRVLNDFIDRMITAPLDAPCPTMEKLPRDMIRDGVYLEQAVTHRLAHFVADTLTKAATVNLLFIISLSRAALPRCRVCGCWLCCDERASPESGAHHRHLRSRLLHVLVFHGVVAHGFHQILLASWV